MHAPSHALALVSAEASITRRVGNADVQVINMSWCLVLVPLLMCRVSERRAGIKHVVIKACQMSMSWNTNIVIRVVIVEQIDIVL